MCASRGVVTTPRQTPTSRGTVAAPALAVVPNATTEEVTEGAAETVKVARQEGAELV